MDGRTGGRADGWTKSLILYTHSTYIYILYIIYIYICILAELQLTCECSLSQATGSWDYTVRLWNLEVPVEPSHVTPDGDAEENGEERKPKNVRTLHGHKGNIHAVAFSKEDMLVSGNTVA